MIPGLVPSRFPALEPPLTFLFLHYAVCLLQEHLSWRLLLQTLTTLHTAAVQEWFTVYWMEKSSSLLIDILVRRNSKSCFFIIHLFFSVLKCLSISLIFTNQNVQDHSLNHKISWLCIVVQFLPRRSIPVTGVAILCCVYSAKRKTKHVSIVRYAVENYLHIHLFSPFVFNVLGHQTNFKLKQYYLLFIIYWKYLFSNKKMY